MPIYTLYLFLILLQFPDQTILIHKYKYYQNIYNSKNSKIIIKQPKKQKNKKQIQKMSYKATIDIFINFSYIQVRFLNRQGYLRYRTKIYMKYQDKQQTCHPYNIVKGPTLPKIQKNIFPQQQQTNIQINSQIDSDTLYYYSRLIPIIYRPSNYQQNQTVFFKAYINTQLLEDIQFYCIIECLFTQNPQKNVQMQVVSKFEARINKIYDISTFLPCVFDVFQGFMIMSSFHATILEFRFSQDDFQTLGNNTNNNKNNSKSIGIGISNKNSNKNKRVELIHKNCTDLYNYLDYITHSFNRQQLYNFYQYYRQFLHKQYQSLTYRYKQLSQQISKQIKTKLKNQQTMQQIIEIKPNKQLLTLIKQNSNIFANSNQISIISKEECNLVVDMIAKDLSLIKGYIYKKWMEFANLIINNSKIIAKYYRKQYQILCKQRFKNNVFSHKIKNHDWRLSKYQDSGKTNLQHAFKQKKKINTQQELWKQHFPIQNITYFGKSETNVKMFQQIYITNNNSNSNNSNNSVNYNNYQMVQNRIKTRHIIILVHGFQATRQDFVLLKNCLQVVYGVHVIISTCNQGQTQHSIVIAGKRLANQIKKLLATQNGQYRLSFIGHSMGGLIIRSAMPDLFHLRDKFYTYLTFSSPHLGYLYQSSALIKMGLWVLSSWQKIQSLQQLTMKDNTNLRQTVLYNLSKNNSLKYFKNLCFVCSSLDQYVSYQSARVQQNQKLMTQTLDKNIQQIIREMVNGIIGDIQAAQISRINVVFNIQNKNLDSFLGRTGHVKFLSDIQFIREFCSCFDKFFA